MRLAGAGIALWIASVSVAPAVANWFDGASLRLAGGHKLPIGAAITPSPDDLCAIGDSDNDRCYTDAAHKVRKDYVLNEKTWHYQEVRPRPDDKKQTTERAETQQRPVSEGP
jgi:hypothetical protein